MRKDLKTGDKVRFSGKEATVLCCEGNQVLVHTSIKRVLWIYFEQIEPWPEAAV